MLAILQWIAKQTFYELSEYLWIQPSDDVHPTSSPHWSYEYVMEHGGTH